MSINYVHAKDIAQRLLRRRPIWRRQPTVSLDGKEGEFGVLTFDFGSDEKVEHRIYIKDRTHIIKEAEKAIESDFFDDVAQEYYEIWRR